MWSSKRSASRRRAPSAGPVPTRSGSGTVIIAFGTNDFFRGAQPKAIVDAYAETKAKIERAGVRCLIALTPPTQPPQSPGLNEAIRDFMMSLHRR